MMVMPDALKLIYNSQPMLGEKISCGRATTIDSQIHPENLNRGWVIAWTGLTQPFVTWVMYRDKPGDEWQTGDGRYFDSLDDAVKNYDDRRGANG